MPHNPTVNGLWRILVHDPGPGDPKWVIGTVVDLDDVRPAGWTPGLDEDTVAWTAGRAGHPVELTELRHARVWLISEVQR